LQLRAVTLYFPQQMRYMTEERGGSHVEGLLPRSRERTLLSAAVLQSCGVAVEKAKDV